MNHDDLLNNVKALAKGWTLPPHDEETQTTVQSWLDRCESDPAAREALIDAFYTELSFGTGGMRGKMGPGINRINATTIARATQGLANHLRAKHGDAEGLRVAVACDSRNQSQEFAQITAEVLAANGFEAWLYPELRPTPQLSWTVRQLGAVGGVVITASHNPPIYNGYKVYAADGGQVVAPDDKDLVQAVRSIPVDAVIARSASGVHELDASWDQGYRDMLKSFSLSSHLRSEGSDLSIVFTGLHGTGALAVPSALAHFGFRCVHEVASQAIPDGNFPTVASPNPEEGPALAEAVALAREVGAALVMGTDPDSDRVGLAVPDGAGDYVLLNGNETAALLTDHVLSKWAEAGRLDTPSFVAKTVVTTALLEDIAAHYGVAVRETLTGFKFIAEAIREEEGSMQYVVGGEESYGYLVGSEVRDKDAVQSCCLLAELAHELSLNGETMTQRLAALHARHKAYKEGLVSLVKEGREGKAQIDAMMEAYRNDTPQTLAGERVVELRDYASGDIKDAEGRVIGTLSQARSNVLQFVTEAGSRVTVRPSGTEPKIKCYASVCRPWNPEESSHAEMMKALQHQVEAHFKALGVA
ncbi:MAG: phospho-sugar mutase [Bacteroidetes bacterium]|nr:phospho-sugar mutase [Bacteroidota bacterium]